MNDRQRILGQLRQQSLQARAQALNEQARNRRSLTPIVPSSGGNGCNPASGIGMYLTFDIEGIPFGPLKSLARMEYQGVDEGGKPTYASTLIPEQGEFTLSYDYGVGKWKFIISSIPNSPYYSDTLIGSNWIQSNPQQGNPTILSECGYRELPVYCIDAGELGLVQPFPTWPGSQSVTEVPLVWFGFDVSAIWIPLIEPGNDGWFFPVGEEEGVVRGCSVNELPWGEVS